ncbi:MAG: HlyC/CorC family transporter [Clostridia bacterium]|nr:HlyC/CorC family transporter [Clostridia bacterium]
MVICLLLSAFFSATEKAFTSMNKTRLKTHAEQGKKRASLALKLGEKQDRLLATVYTCNTVSKITLAAFSTLLFLLLLPNFGALVGVAVAAAAMLLFGEITPKALAKEFPEKFAMFAAPLMQLLVWILLPITCFFAGWKFLLSKMFKSKEDNKRSQEELLLLVEEVQQDGSIDQDESSLLKNVIEFTDLKASEILTHRVDIEGFSIDTPKAEIAKRFSETKFSRLLAYEEDLDHIVGVLHQKDFYAENGITEREVSELITEPLYIPEATKISDLLKQLQSNQAHLAVVVGEYGETVGIVTMEDILEELVGEIWDEHDEVVEVFHQIDDTTCRMAGDVELSEFCERFEIELDSTSSTLNGWIAEQLSKIAEEGDSFVYQNLSVTVLETDSHRASFVEVVVLPEEVAKEDAEEESDDKKED